MTDRREAKKLLGIPQDQNLTVRQRLCVKGVQDALDQGACFNERADAERYARHHWNRLLIALALVVLSSIAAFWMFHAGGWIEGFNDGLEFCQRTATIVR